MKKWGMGMRVLSLSGPSGTGKSTSALEFAYKHNIEAIIDDGLLIRNGEKLAGTSAKFEKNALTAVRRAVFEDEAHRNEVIKAIQKHQLETILLIGTSDKMTKKIAKALELDEIEHFYYINEIRTPQEIELAKFVRQTLGKHVMPIPVRQVEQNFFKRLIQRGREIFFNAKKIGETTIVRPDFHSEVVDIHKNVYFQLAMYEASNDPIIMKVDSLKIEHDIMPIIKFTLILKAPIHYNVPTELKRFQQKIADSFQFHFGIAPDCIHLTIKGIREKGNQDS